MGLDCDWDVAQSHSKVHLGQSVDEMSVLLLQEGVHRLEPVRRGRARGPEVRQLTPTQADLLEAHLGHLVTYARKVRARARSAFRGRGGAEQAAKDYGFGCSRMKRATVE